MSEGYEYSDGKTISRSLIQSEYIDDYFRSAKPSLSLFLRPSDELHITSDFSLTRQRYRDNKDYDSKEKSANIFLAYMPINNISLGGSAASDKFKMDDLAYMNNSNITYKPFLGIELHKRFDLTLARIMSNKEYGERQFPTLAPINEDYEKNELMITYSFPRGQFISLGFDKAKNESNFFLYNYHVKAFSISGKFKLYRKVKATFSYRKAIIEYDRIPLSREALFLLGPDYPFRAANRDTLISTRKDTEEMVNLQIYSIINSWLKLSLDYGFVSNHSSYSWEEYKSHIVFFSIKIFQRYKK